ncbi:MAG: hypothetical protein Q8P51_10210 [Ignavibacteria bacterium]|nr:hypothetical protein [Ignavibacteria bacterium]
MDTFHNSFTKDLLVDGSITDSFVLSPDELHSIELKLLEIDFFNYPDAFVPPASDTPFAYFEPSDIFVFRVKPGSTIKTLYWNTGISPSPSSIVAMKLQEAITPSSKVHPGQNSIWISLDPRG